MLLAFNHVDDGDALHVGLQRGHVRRADRHRAAHRVPQQHELVHLRAKQLEQHLLHVTGKQNSYLLFILQPN